MALKGLPDDFHATRIALFSCVRRVSLLLGIPKTLIIFIKHFLSDLCLLAKSLLIYKNDLGSFRQVFLMKSQYLFI